MNTYLHISCIAASLAAVVHSYLGETRLFRPLFAEANHIGVMKSLTWRRVARAVWHLPSVSWVLMSAMTVVMVQQEPFSSTPLYFAAAVYLFSGIGNFIATRGKHFGWAVLFLAAASLGMGL